MRKDKLGKDKLGKDKLGKGDLAKDKLGKDKAGEIKFAKGKTMPDKRAATRIASAKNPGRARQDPRRPSPRHQRRAGAPAAAAVPRRRRLHRRSARRRDPLRLDRNGVPCRPQRVAADRRRDRGPARADRRRRAGERHHRRHALSFQPAAGTAGRRRGALAGNRARRHRVAELRLPHRPGHGVRHVEPGGNAGAIHHREAQARRSAQGRDRPRRAGGGDRLQGRRQVIPISPARSSSNTTRSARPEQAHSHGTGMAGAIVSHRKLLGIAPGARILAVHAFSTSTRQSPEATTRQIIAGIEWAINKGARIINMSFAGPYDPMIQLAMRNAAAKGVILIAASGNMGAKSPPLYPAADPHVIAVTATDESDKLFTQAVRGPHVAVAAPGVDVDGAGPRRHLSAHHRHVGCRRACQRRRRAAAGAASVGRCADRARGADLDRAQPQSQGPRRPVRLGADRSGGRPARTRQPDCGRQADRHRQAGGPKAAATKSATAPKPAAPKTASPNPNVPNSAPRPASSLDRRPRAKRLNAGLAIGAVADQRSDELFTHRQQVRRVRVGFCQRPPSPDHSRNAGSGRSHSLRRDLLLAALALALRAQLFVGREHREVGIKRRLRRQLRARRPGIDRILGDRAREARRCEDPYRGQGDPR